MKNHICPTLAPGAKMQIPRMQHICYGANSCENVINHLKCINALFENHFCEAMIERQNHMKCSDIWTH